MKRFLETKEEKKDFDDDDETFATTRDIYYLVLLTRIL